MLRILTYLTAFAGMNSIMKTTRLISTNSAQNCITIKFYNGKNMQHFEDISTNVAEVLMLVTELLLFSLLMPAPGNVRRSKIRNSHQKIGALEIGK